jgi:type IV secretory pathway VirB10-like protein
MSSRILVAMLAAGCVTAAAGGAYVAVRQNAPVPAVVPAASAPAAAPAATKPVSETEALVDRTPVNPPQAEQAPVPERKAAPVQASPEPRPARATRPDPVRTPEPRRAAPAPARAEVPVSPSRPAASMNHPAERPSTEIPAATGLPETPADSAGSPEPRPALREPQFEEVVLPASSVLGLQVETPLSSERTRIEDRVDARVTRDVTAGGRVAIPSGSRVIGSVTLVERGGKMKERARLGVRFHTLVLADGREVPLRTEAIIREGDSPSSESARKIGGAAIGGAILGAIMGGGKGAMVGSAAGAAGGSAAVMAGDRNAATLPAGTIVSVRLASPATIDVERPPQ